MTIRFVSGVAIIGLDGPLLLGPSSDALRDAVDGLLDGNHRSILVDLSEANNVDSAGLGTLIAAYASTVRHGGMLSLLHPTPRALQVLRMTKSDSLFEISDQEDQAIQSFTSGNVARGKFHLQQFLGDE